MFIRVNKNSTGTAYVQVVRSYRESGKVRQQVLFSFGRLDILQATGQMDALVKKLSKYAFSQEVLDLREDISIDKVYYLGAAHVIDRMMERLEFKKLFKSLAAQHPKLELPWSTLVTGMLMSRFINPCSKRRLCQEQWGRIYPEILGSAVPPLVDFYRAMDVLGKHRAEVEGLLFDGMGKRDLFNQELEVIFYDMTTLRFESVDNERGDLRRFGYSKEKRSDCTQVMLGLLIDGDGVPVGYELFPGNTYEPHSLPKIIEKLQEKYRIRRIVLVADRGIITKDNLKKLSAAKMEYILGMRLWSLTEAEQKKVLQWKGYRPLNKEQSAFVRTLDFKGDRLVLSWTQERAERDAQVREDVLKKIRLQLEADPQPKKFVTHKGYKQYLKGLNEGTPELDSAAIESAKRRDGFFGVLTNIPADNLSEEKVYGHYKELWRIEDAFGEIKGPLKTRPMFHWTDARIESHVLICLLAYYVEAIMMRDLRKEKAEFTTMEWFRALNEVYAIPVTVRGTRVWTRNEIQGVAARGYELLHIKPPDRILKMEKINITQNVVAQI